MDRVGGILKNGFELAGRQFEFLAYSQSALREHAVWFINPFRHPTSGYVDAQSIRDSLGNFEGVILQPSKYAARIAQAFTATDPSVTVTRDQWEEVPDMGAEPYLFTDGVGTISVQLGDMIWEKLCEQMPEGRHKRSIKPSAVSPHSLSPRWSVECLWLVSNSIPRQGLPSTLTGVIKLTYSSQASRGWLRLTSDWKVSRCAYDLP